MEHTHIQKDTSKYIDIGDYIIFSPNQNVFFMHENMVNNGPIEKVLIEINNDGINTDYVINLITVGSSGTFEVYDTIVLPSKKLFASKQQLVESL